MTLPPLTVPRSASILAGSWVSSRPCSGRSLACPELRRARPDAGSDRCLSPQRRSCARPLGFPGIADLPIGSWVSRSSFFLPVALASRPELRRVMRALFRFPVPIIVGTAFRGGPPTQLLGYSKTDNFAIPNLPPQPRTLLEASNPSPIAPSPSALSANLCSLCGNFFPPLSTLQRPR